MDFILSDTKCFQAKKVDENSPSGLIPSQSLEEKRKAFVRPEYDYTHKSCEYAVPEIPDLSLRFLLELPHA